MEQMIILGHGAERISATELYWEVEQANEHIAVSYTHLIMLALKNVLTAGEDVGMLIFDEIDTGVSGHAAQQIGRKLSAIAKKKQTLCVTHLPQIAAMGDHHLRISKSVRDGRSYTDVSPMDRAHRVDEIARLLSGEEISDAARRNAEELLDAAGQGV